MKKVLYLNSAYQADVTEVKQAERSGGDGFGLDEVLQDIRGRCLDVTIVLTHTHRHRRIHKSEKAHLHDPAYYMSHTHQTSHSVTQKHRFITPTEAVCVFLNTQTHHHLIQQLIDEGKVHLHRLLRQTATVILN